jgi:alpha-ketoglutaric semialdehyde dehydrogenase
MEGSICTAGTRYEVASTPLQGKNYINGCWQAASQPRLFEDRSPNHPEDCLGYFPDSSSADVATAVAAAVDAFPAWKATPAPKRAQYLYKLATHLEGMKESLAVEMTREMGKSLEEARGDIQEAIDMALYVAGEGRRLTGKTTPCELPNKLAFTLRQPVGVCGLITPWNFPIAVPSWKILPCLLAGNTAVFKPSEEAPLMGQRLVEAFEAVGLPPGVLNLVQGKGATAGQALVEHPDVRLISFTGSSETGAQVASRCGALHKRVALELGGKNACIIMNDANLALAAKGVAWGAFGTSGQRCTATSRVLVQKEVKARFMEALLQEAQALEVGDTTAGATIGPLINAAQRDKVVGHIRQALHEGAICLLGGEALHQRKGYFVAPTILDGVQPHMAVAREEVFGPVLAVLEFETLEEAIALANDVEYGLSSAIYTRDVSQALRAVEALEAGITYVNAPSIGAEVHLPFGGVKKTGNGSREAADVVLDTYTEWKTVYIDYSDTLQRAQMDVDWA